MSARLSTDTIAQHGPGKSAGRSPQVGVPLVGCSALSGGGAPEAQKRT